VSFEVPPSWVPALDELRRKQPDWPTRNALLRRLLGETFQKAGISLEGGDDPKIDFLLIAGSR
jgi:hypothetical protein